MRIAGLAAFVGISVLALLAQSAPASAADCKALVKPSPFGPGDQTGATNPATPALVPAGGTRVVGAVLSAGPNGEGLTRALQSAAEAGADWANSARTDMPTNAANPAILMVAPPLSRSVLGLRW